MRGLLKISLMLILGPQAIDSTAQELMPLFGEPTRTWTSRFWGSSFGDCLETWRTRHATDGDTLISEVNYQRIRSYTTYTLSSIQVFCDESSYNYGPNIFIREDSGKVHMYMPNEDLLIYDLTLNVGDSIPEVFTSAFGTISISNDPQHREIIAIDSIMIDGTFRKRMLLELHEYSMDTTAIIEGIGSTSGLFNPFSDRAGISHFLELSCVAENGESIYTSEGSPSCFLTNNISEEDSDRSSIHPNPSTGIIHFSDQLAFDVFDPTGRMIQSGRSTTTDLSDHPSGIYFVRTLHDGQWSHHKVIIEK